VQVVRDRIIEATYIIGTQKYYNHINNDDKLHPSDQSEYERLMNNSESSYTTDADSSKDNKKRKKNKRRKILHESQLRYLTPVQLRIENALVRNLKEERKEKIRVARNLRTREGRRLYSINGQHDYNNCIMKATMECLKKNSRASVPEVQYDYRSLPYKRLNLIGAPKPNLKHYLNSEERKTELKYDFFQFNHLQQHFLSQQIICFHITSIRYNTASNLFNVGCYSYLLLVQSNAIHTPLALQAIDLAFLQGREIQNSQHSRVIETLESSTTATESTIPKQQFAL